MARDRALRVLLSLWLLVFVSAAANAEKKKPPLKPVNINTATSEELQRVPGIGPATAQKILQMRKSYGPFKSVDDLLAIRGLGQKRLDKMRKYLTVSGPHKAPSQSSSPPNEKQRSNVSSQSQRFGSSPILYRKDEQVRSFPIEMTKTPPPHCFEMWTSI